MNTRGLTVAALLALVAPLATAQAELPPAEVASWTQDRQDGYALAVRRCARCHSVEHALDHQMTLANWRVALRRMMRLRGATTTGVEAAEIAEFRAFYVGWMGRQ